MKREIEAILKGVPGVKVDQVEQLWRIRILGGRRTGARVNGVSLARDMLKKYSREIEEAKALEARPETPPATDYDAIIASLKAQLAEAQAKTVFAPHAEPVEVAMPEFLKGPEMPPPELADLIEYADTPAQSNEKLLVRLREVLGLIGLAEDAGGRAAPELYRRKDRLESGIRYNRGRMAETI